MMALLSPRPMLLAFVVSASLWSSAGCDSKATQEAPKPAPAPEANTASEPIEAPIEPEPIAAVERFTADPADAPADLVEGGRVLDQVGWTDSEGKHLLFLVRHDRQEGEYAGSASLIIAHYLDMTPLEAPETEEAVEDAGLKELSREQVVVERCEFDIVLEPVLGDWSVTDLDADGVGELTLAWTAECTSDISPETHVVRVSEGAEGYALRGVTRVDPGDGAMGGEFEAEAGFEDAPAAFREHAEKVWAQTSGR